MDCHWDGSRGIFAQFQPRENRRGAGRRNRRGEAGKAGGSLSQIWDEFHRKLTGIVSMAGEKGGEEEREGIENRKGRI